MGSHNSPMSKVPQKRPRDISDDASVTPSPKATRFEVPEEIKLFLRNPEAPTSSLDGLPFFFDHMRKVAAMFTPSELRFMEEYPLIIPSVVESLGEPGYSERLVAGHVEHFRPIAGGLLVEKLACSCSEMFLATRLLLKRVVDPASTYGPEIVQCAFGRARSKFCFGCRFDLVKEIAKPHLDSVDDDDLSTVRRIAVGLGLEPDMFQKGSVVSPSEVVKARDRASAREPEDLVRLDVLFVLRTRRTVTGVRRRELFAREDARASLVRFLEHGVQEIVFIPWGQVPDERLVEFSTRYSWLAKPSILRRLLDAGGSLDPLRGFCDPGTWKMVQQTPDPAERHQLLRCFVRGIRFIDAKIRAHLLKASNLELIDRDRAAISFEGWMSCVAMEEIPSMDCPALLKILLPVVPVDVLFKFLTISWASTIVSPDIVHAVAAYAGVWSLRHHKMTQAEIRDAAKEIQGVFSDQGSSPQVRRNMVRALIRCVIALRNASWATSAKESIAKTVVYAMALIHGSVPSWGEGWGGVAACIAKF